MSEPLGATAVLPWMQPAQQAIARAIDSDRLGHAVLLQVPNGLGGDWLAHWIAARVFCRADAPRPCGQCLDCRRTFADEHPDCSVVQPVGDSKEIRIDQVRETSAALALSSHGGSRKLAILWPADRLNRFAANALAEDARGTDPRHAAGAGGRGTRPPAGDRPQPLHPDHRGGAGPGRDARLAARARAPRASTGRPCSVPSATGR